MVAKNRCRSITERNGYYYGTVEADGQTTTVGPFASHVDAFDAIVAVRARYTMRSRGNGVWERNGKFLAKLSGKWLGTYATQDEARAVVASARAEHEAAKAAKRAGRLAVPPCAVCGNPGGPIIFGNSRPTRYKTSRGLVCGTCKQTISEVERNRQKSLAAPCDECGTRAGRCRHGSLVPVRWTTPRGKLCYDCRDRHYPPASTYPRKPSTTLKRDDNEMVACLRTRLYPDDLAELPTQAKPGSPEKIAVLAARAERGCPLHCFGDRKDFTRWAQALAAIRTDRADDVA